MESGYELTQTVLRQGPAPTAVLCGNDRMALGALLALSEAGLQVSADVSVVGYVDQVGLAANVHPSLTTVRLPYYAMGRWAADQLLNHRVESLPGGQRCRVCPISASPGPRRPPQPADPE